jgi:hypothetical protein
MYVVSPEVEVVSHKTNCNASAKGKQVQKENIPVTTTLGSIYSELLLWHYDFVKVLARTQ